MKKRFLSSALFIGFTSLFTLSHAAIVGDINNDGRVDLAESIYALQVAAGQFPDLAPSCLLSGTGGWEAMTSYVECDVVIHSGSLYVCTEGHISSESFDIDSANWDLINLEKEWQQNGNDIYHSGGNVGIGTSSPTVPFQLTYEATIYGDNELARFGLLPDGQTFGNAYLTILGQRRGISQTNTAFINLDNYDADESTPQYTMARISGGNPLDEGNLGHLIFYTNPGNSLTERVRISAEGNVGIGTTDPQSQLHVKSELSNAVVSIGNSDSANDALVNFSVAGRSVSMGLASGGGNLFHITDGDKSLDEGILLTIKDGGNVGIGTTDPQSKLAVVGLPTGTNDSVVDGNLSGALCITNTGNLYIDTDGTCAN